MKKNLWIIAIALVVAAASLLAVWQVLGLEQANDFVVTTGAVSWLALALAGFGTLAATDPFRTHA